MSALFQKLAQKDIHRTLQLYIITKIVFIKIKKKKINIFLNAYIKQSGFDTNYVLYKAFNAWKNTTGAAVK